MPDSNSRDEWNAAPDQNATPSSSNQTQATDNDLDDFDLSDLDDPFADPNPAAEESSNNDDAGLLDTPDPTDAPNSTVENPFGDDDDFDTPETETDTTSTPGAEDTTYPQDDFTDTSEEAITTSIEIEAEDQPNNDEAETSIDTSGIEASLDEEEENVITIDDDTDISITPDANHDFDLNDLEIMEQEEQESMAEDADAAAPDTQNASDTPASTLEETKEHTEASGSGGLFDHINEETSNMAAQSVSGKASDQENRIMETPKSKLMTYLPWIAIGTGILGVILGGLGSWMVTQDREEIAALDDMLYNMQSNIASPTAEKDAALTEMKDQIIYLEKQINDLKVEQKNTPQTPPATSNPTTTATDSTTSAANVATGTSGFTPIQKPTEKEPELQLNLLEFDHSAKTESKAAASQPATQATTNTQNVTTPKPATNHITGTRWIINIASFLTQSRAQMEQERLRGLGVETVISIHPSKGKTWYRLQYATPFADKNQASQTIARIRSVPGIDSMWLEKRNH